MIAIRKPIPRDIDIIGPELRPEIAATIAGCSDTAPEAIRRTLDMSIVARIAYADGKPLALWGLAAPAGFILDWGMPWCMSTPYVDNHKHVFWRHSKTFLDWCLTVYPRLETFCDVEHARSAKWLRSLGFEMHEPKILQPGGPPFHVAVLKGG